MLKLDFKNIHIIPPAGLIKQHLFKRVLKSVFIQHAVKLYRLCNASHGLPWLTLLWQQRAGALFIRGAQHGQTGFRTAVHEQGHTPQEQELLLWPQSTWNEVIWGTCMMCSPGHAGPQRGWNQMVSVNLEALTADDLMLSWSLVSYMTSRKVLSADWAVKCFQRGYGCTTCLEDVRTSAHQSCTCLMKGWGENPTESKRSLAATVSSCNYQQASTAGKSVLRRFSYSWGCATPSFRPRPELVAPCEKWTWKNSQKMAEIPPQSLNPVS